MKHLTKNLAIRSFLTCLMIACFQTLLWAQESSGSGSSSSTTVTKTAETTSTGNWYTSPWVWVAGGAVFILLLVALMRVGGSSSSGGATTSRTDRVTVKRSTTVD